MTESFWKNLTRSNLLAADQNQAVRERFADTPAAEDAAVTAWLTEQGWLTAWQGEMLLAGHTVFFWAVTA